MLAKEFAEWAFTTALAEHGVRVDTAGREELGVDVADLVQHRARLYLAEVDGRPAGVAGLKPITHAIGEIKRPYARPSFRGHGIGRSLVQRLLDDADALGYRTVRLETSALMREAQALYRRFGYVEIPPYEGREFKGVDSVSGIAVFMERRLAA